MPRLGLRVSQVPRRRGGGGRRLRVQSCRGDRRPQARPGVLRGRREHRALRRLRGHRLREAGPRPHQQALGRSRGERRGRREAGPGRHGVGRGVQRRQADPLHVEEQDLPARAARRPLALLRRRQLRVAPGQGGQRQGLRRLRGRGASRRRGLDGAGPRPHHAAEGRLRGERGGRGGGRRRRQGPRAQGGPGGEQAGPLHEERRGGGRRRRTRSGGPQRLPGRAGHGVALGRRQGPGQLRSLCRGPGA
mmetsp:Transcript_18632/g.52636  ORF Transcript_18632/g.52636 Transcript_18632/m.52636 type:complete len:248 (-) Transcript_18632:392-1135(-)